MSKVIAFANQKGGVAKTTTTLNLAVAFVEEGHRVLCVDIDCLFKLFPRFSKSIPRA